MGKTKILKNNQGSILVGAVALAILMALAGTGFILVTANSVNSETAAIENEKAFQAAESGVWIGARWLRSNLNNAGASFTSTAIPINGMNVYVTIARNGSPVVASINSEVHKSGTPSAATFKKRIRVGNITSQNFGVFCTFYGGYQPMDCDAANWNGANWLNPWGGWKSIVTYNGRTHLNNMALKLYDQPGSKFNGLVTVAAGNGQNNYGIGDRGNNYNFGIFGFGDGSGTPSLAQLNACFTDRYIPNVDPIVLSIMDTSASSLATSSSITAAQRLTLPLSWKDDGYGPYQYRPTLRFNGTTATYCWQKDATTWKDSNITDFDGKVFLCPNNLNVYSIGGGVTGNVTIATVSGKSIVPVGNLIVNNYDVTSGTLTNPSTNNNMIGLISGAYIAFNKTWKRRFETTAETIEYVSSRTTGTGAAGSFDATPLATHTLHMTASIMAVCHFNDNLYNSYDAGTFTKQNFPMSGTEKWDGMWGPTPGPNINGSPFDSTYNKCEDYGFQLYGNHLVAGYARSIYPSNNKWRGCGGVITFNHDPRMYQRNLQPPGFPGVKNGTTLLTLRLRNWSEENKYN